jgi:membrane protein
MNRRDLIKLMKTSFKDWREDNAVIRAGALTFFIILPLPSLLLIVIAIFGQIYGPTQAVDIVVQQISALAGPAVANLFNQLLQGATSPFTSVWGDVWLVAFSLVGGIGAFAVLRETMDIIWEVKLPVKQKLTEKIQEKIGPFILVSLLGLIVIAWTGVATSLFSAIRVYSINATLTLVSITIVQIGLSFALSSLLFAIIYKEIPQVKIHWADVNIAAIITGIAFTLTNYIFGVYIQTFTVTTLIGAAGSLLIILLWIFILNQIVLFGAEVSKVYATTWGPHPHLHIVGLAHRFVGPIEKAGEIFEEATKGAFVEGVVKEEEKTQIKEAIQKETPAPVKEEIVEELQKVSVEEKASSEHKSDESSFEINDKTKSSKKPQKDPD